MKKPKNATHGSPHTAKKERSTPRGCTDGIPEGFFATEGGFSIHRVFWEEEVAVLELNAHFPLPQTAWEGKRGARAAGRIRALYTEMATRLWAQVRTHLLPAAAHAYRKDNDPLKRFRHARLILSVSGEALEENGQVFSVRRQVRLTRGGRCLYEATEGETLSKKSGLPLPSPRKKKKQAQKKKKEAKA